MIAIRPATPQDFPQIYALFQQILQEGSTYSYAPSEMTEERSRDYWMGLHHHCMVADNGGQVAGCYTIRPNRTGRAGHVANASFIVAPAFRRKGIGRRLGEKALQHAAQLGYQAIQYNFVVSVNEGAVALWKLLGFSIVGTLPKGFQHAGKGLVDVYIMHRFLSDQPKS